MKSLRLGSDGNLALTNGKLEFITQLDALKQSVKTRLLTFQGEWFLDNTEGTPWVQIVLSKPFNPSAAESAIRTVILGTEGVMGLTSFSFKQESNNDRRVNIAFTARTIFGNLQSEDTLII